MALVHACSICKAHLSLLCRCLLCSQLSVCFRQACNWHFKFFPRNVFLSCVVALMAQHGVVRTRGNSCISALLWGWAVLVHEKNPGVDMVGLGNAGAWEESPCEQGWETVLELCCAQDTSITHSHKWERKHRERRAQTGAISLQLEVTGSYGLICRISGMLCTGWDCCVVLVL